MLKISTFLLFDFACVDFDCIVNIKGILVYIDGRLELEINKNTKREF